MHDKCSSTDKTGLSLQREPLWPIKYKIQILNCFISISFPMVHQLPVSSHHSCWLTTYIVYRSYQTSTDSKRSTVAMSKYMARVIDSL